MQVGDPGAEISRAALEDGCPLCIQALDMFIQIYGATAGDLALTTLSVGGIYLGGGITPKILPRLQTGIFMEAFCNKGRFSEMMKGIPVYAIVDPYAPLYGAAYNARRLI